MNQLLLSPWFKWMGGLTVLVLLMGATSSQSHVVSFTLADPMHQENSQFGFALAEVGDINQDGKPDYLVGARSQDVGGYEAQGQAFVFSGMDGSLLLTLNDPIPQAYADFGFAVAGPGDINGDGVGDLLVGAYAQRVAGNYAQGQVFVFSGQDGSLLQTLDTPNPQGYAYFGRAAAELGDVNGDGLADLLIGAPGQTVNNNEFQGQVLVFSGADGELLYTLNTPFAQGGAQFGAAVAGVGDVDQDNVPDILVGAPTLTVNTQTSQGRAFVFSGATGTLLYTLDDPLPHAYAWFGDSLSGLEDINRDGVPDLLVGAPIQEVDGRKNQGQVFAFSGADGQLLYTLNDPMPKAYAWFGYAVSGLGDTNGDGGPDILVGAFRQEVNGNFNQGQAFVFDGADGHLLMTVDDPAPQAEALFGHTVASAGDVNGDGLTDFLISALYKAVNGLTGQGQVFVFESVKAEAKEVQIDIQPGNDANVIYARQTQPIKVAILASQGFDAPTVVDNTSLTFGKTGDEHSLVWRHGSPSCRAQDVNADGKVDLVCAFSPLIAGFACGDTVGIIKGATLDGIPIIGQDFVTIKNCRLAAP
ncbi:MAG: FG-GAP repeat protein [Anaerolineae bacterium]|nr:FG-GAP repeat protein [Anaerolineae bacterium]